MNCDRMTEFPSCLGYVYTIPDSLCADTKTISDRASVHKGIVNFGAVFTTEQRCAASKVNRHVSERFSYHSLALCEQVPDRSGNQELGGRIGFHSICVDFCYSVCIYVFCIQFTALYHEFNCFESPEKLK